MSKRTAVDDDATVEVTCTKVKKKQKEIDLGVYAVQMPEG